VTSPAIAVVVPTHDRAHLLPRLVACLAAQRDAGDFEVVIVDDASTDDTPRVLAALASRSAIPVHVERLPRNAGPATARNVGWRATSAPVVAFTDDDCLPQPQWLARLRASAEVADIVQGRTLPEPSQRERAGPFSRLLVVGHETGFYQTCNIAYRRTVLEQHGGFDESFRYPAGEDSDLAWRAKDAGATTCFDPDALVFHDVPPSSFGGALRDSWRWQGAVHAASKHPALRSMMASRHVWRPAHRYVAVGLAGAVRVAVRPRSVASWAIAAAALTPYALYRGKTDPLPGLGPRRRWAMVPAAFVVDAAEVAACAVGSARHGIVVI
jgi:cellulose synthase/poly-beta-1,6-N-acetylglucosamine synthase-like glycosyltransferase